MSDQNQFHAELTSEKRTQDATKTLCRFESEMGIFRTGESTLQGKNVN